MAVVQIAQNRLVKPSISFKSSRPRLIPMNTQYEICVKGIVEKKMTINIDMCFCAAVMCKVNIPQVKCNWMGRFV